MYILFFFFLLLCDICDMNKWSLSLSLSLCLVTNLRGYEVT